MPKKRTRWGKGDGSIMGAAILIVEDEYSIAELLKERFDDKGYQVKVAYTGAQAMKALKGNNPDVITLDIFLPDANGLNLLRELKKHPETNTIPVIIISSSDEGEGAKELGAEGFIKKPIDFKKLFSVIESLRSAKEKIA
jgi:DNA-binding response OmpR family regulator